MAMEFAYDQPKSHAHVIAPLWCRALHAVNLPITKCVCVLVVPALGDMPMPLPIFWNARV